MRALAEIIAESDEATRKARKRKAKLYIAKQDGDEGIKAIPLLGHYQPEGWEYTESYFVDSSGFGSESDPALAFGQFLAKVKKGYGYAIREVGQFQIYVNEFKKI